MSLFRKIYSNVEKPFESTQKFDIQKSAVEITLQTASVIARQTFNQLNVSHEPRRGPKDKLYPGSFSVVR